MFISSMIIKVLPEKAEEMLAKLKKMSEVTTYGIHNDNNIIAVAEAEEINELELLSKRIVDECEAVLAVYPTYVASDEAD